MKNDDNEGPPDTTNEFDQDNSEHVLLRELEIFHEDYFSHHFSDFPNFAGVLEIDTSNLTPPSNGIPSNGNRQPLTVDSRILNSVVSTVQFPTRSSTLNDPDSKNYWNSGNGWILSSPIFVLNLEDVPGMYNLRVNIQPPPPTNRGNNKWMYSDALKKLYVKKDTCVPVTVDIDCYLNDVDILLCPVFSGFEKRLSTVRRCPICLAKDTSNVSGHIVQVTGVDASYFEEDGRLLTRISMGGGHLDFLMQIGCHNSCSGGPNGSNFGILFTLVRGNCEVGRRFIGIKCCSNPRRSFVPENSPTFVCAPSMEFVPVGNCNKKTKKRKHEMDGTKDTEKTVLLEVPLKYVDGIKKFIQEEESKKKKRKHESESD